MEIINYDCNGNLIEDLSKVVLPPEKSLMIYEMLLESIEKDELKNKLNINNNEDQQSKD